MYFEYVAELFRYEFFSLLPPTRPNGLRAYLPAYAIFTQAVNTLQSGAEEWSRKYILKAPVDGTISFAIFLQEAQQYNLSFLKIIWQQQLVG